MVLVLGKLVLVLVLSIGSIPGSGIGIDYQKAIFLINFSRIFSYSFLKKRQLELSNFIIDEL